MNIRIKYIIRMLITVSLVINACIVQATILTFDDLPPETIFGGGDLYFGIVPDGYGGLDWSDNSAYFNATVDGGNSGYSNATVSGGRIFSPGNIFDPVILSGATIDFIGAYFTAAWRDELNINIKGYNGLALLYEDNIIIDTAGPTWFEANQFSINYLEITAFGGIENPNLSGDGAFYGMDDFTFNIPEPSVILLLGSGLIGLIGFIGAAGLKRA